MAPTSFASHLHRQVKLPKDAERQKMLHKMSFNQRRNLFKDQFASKATKGTKFMKKMIQRAATGELSSAAAGEVSWHHWSGAQTAVYRACDIFYADAGSVQSVLGVYRATSLRPSSSDFMKRPVARPSCTD